MRVTAKVTTKWLFLVRNFYRSIIHMFSPYFWTQFFKLLALVAIVFITYIIPEPTVAAISIFIIGTLIASEAFVLMLTRSLMKEPTDENIVKLFITLFFRDKGNADKILDDYRKEKEEKVEIARLQKQN